MKYLPYIVALAALLGCAEQSPQPVVVKLDTTSLSRPAWFTQEIVDSIQAGIDDGDALGDVPIGACVIVGTDTGKAIFVGHNTTLEFADAAGHAEINALTDAMRWAGGADKFRAIPKDSLYVALSFEPCPMCAGAIALWKIPPSHVAFWMEKRPIWRDPERSAVDALRAGWIVTGDDSLQLSAFCRRASYRNGYPMDCD